MKEALSDTFFDLYIFLIIMQQNYQSILIVALNLNDSNFFEQDPEYFQKLLQNNEPSVLNLFMNSYIEEQNKLKRKNQGLPEETVVNKENKPVTF